MPNEIPVVFHNESNFSYQFIIKKLSNEFEGQFECLRRNTEKSIPIEKEVTKIDKDGIENVVAISYKIKFIDTARFMATSLSYIVDNCKKEFTKLNAKIVIFFFNMKVLKKIQ